MIRKILRSGDPILRKKSKAVTRVDKKILKLVKDLKDTLAIQKDPEGVGLAAPQIGKNLRVFIIDFKNFKRVVINPEVISVATLKTKDQKLKIKNEIMEGCLSLPNYYGPLKRNNKLEVKYLNEKSEEIVEKFEDFDAQIILHEIDHLEGILFMDRLFEQKESLYKVVNNKWKEVELA